MTFWRQSTYGRCFNKVVSTLIIQTFLLSSIAFAIPNDKSPAKLTPQYNIAQNPEKVVIPRDFGLVKSNFVGNSGKLVIHIQDAHCNYEAQSNIVKILESLVKNYKVSFVAVEGADGIIDTSWFKAFPDDEVRKEVADYFMKKGEITGPEFLSITTDYPIKLFGAETRAYYIQNLNAFTSSYPLKEDTEKYYKSVKTALNKLKNYIYSDELKVMDTKIEEYETKKIQFNEYVRFLQGLSETHKINLREYDNFFKLVSTLIYEKRINFNIVDKERSILIDELSKSLAKDALAELVEKSLFFKAAKISSAEYYNYLKELAEKNGIEMVKRFPNLSNYIIYNTVYSKIENEKLFKDIKNLEAAIKEKLFTNDDQRTLSKLSHNVDILLGFVNIKLLNGDFEYYKAHKEEFSYEAFSTFLQKKATQYGLAYDVEAPSEAVINSIPKLEDFYAIAIKRDRALVDNTLNEMNKEKVQVAVLITGGFHSEGISKLLEKDGVSYMVVCPSITKEVPTRYIQILTNQRTSFEDILMGTAEAKTAETGMVAPYLISAARQLSAKDLHEMAEMVGAVKIGDETRSIEDRVKDIEPNWATREVAVWIAGSDKFAGTEGIPSNKDILQEAYLININQAMAAGKFDKADREIIDALVKAAFDKIYSAKAEGTPGTNAIGPYTGLDGNQARVIDSIIRQSYKEGTYKEERVRLNDGREFTFVVHFGLMERVERHNAEVTATGRGVFIPSNLHVHPGRGGDIMKHALLQGHIDSFEFYNLSQAEIQTVAEHEITHIDIFNDNNGLRFRRDTYLEQHSGSNEEDFVDSLPNCDTQRTGIRYKLGRLENIRQRGLAAAIGNSEAMETFLMTDVRYGDAVRNEIIRLRYENRADELEKFVKETFAKRYNIDLIKTSISRRPYNGYDFIIISSSTEDEALSKKETLQKDFAAIPSVRIYSEVCSDDGGQILGHITTLENASREAAREGINLKDLIRNNKIKMAVFHDGGKGERASPITQPLGNARGRQDVIGHYRNSSGELVNAELLPLVILNSLDFAQTNDAKRVDTFWTSQLVAGTVPHTSVRRNNASYDKFLVPIDWTVPENTLASQLFQFGTATTDEEGYIQKFHGSQAYGAAMKLTDGSFALNPESKRIYNELKNSPQAWFDFGSFSMGNAMLIALWDYWMNKRDENGVPIIENYIGNRTLDKKWKRDIDPHFTQPLAFLLQAIVAEPQILDDVFLADVLRRHTGAERQRVLRDAVAHVRDALPDDTRKEMGEIEVDKTTKEEKKVIKDHVTETIEFFLLNRDNEEIFPDLHKVIGSIDLGANAEWQTYRSPIDITNEKLSMLTDITGEVAQINVKGELVKSRAKVQDKITAENARRRGDISDDNLCNFYVNDKHIVLSRKDITGDAPWTGEGVTIHRSIVQSCVLLPGSKIIDSVVHKSQGLIDAKNSYVQRTTAKAVVADRSMVHMVVSDKPVSAISQIVTDVFRPQISGNLLDDRFPEGGHSRLTVPIGYDAKVNDGNVMPGNKFAAGENRTDTGEVGIRGMKCVRGENEFMEAKSRILAMISGNMRVALDKELAKMVSIRALRPQPVKAIFTDLIRLAPDSRMRTEMVFFCNLLIKHGNAAVKRIAKAQKKGLLANSFNIGPTIDPDIYKRDSIRAKDRELPDPVVRAAGTAYVMTLAKLRGKDPSKIVIAVGRESRPNGKRLQDSFIEGCMAAGATIIDATANGAELTSTPIMYFASRYLEQGRLDGIIEVTGSHLKYNLQTGEDNNGFKPTKGPENFTATDMQSWLEATNDVINNPDPAAQGTLQRESLLEPYHVLCMAALEGSSEWLGYVEEVWAGRMTLKEAVDAIRPRVDQYLASKPLRSICLAADSGYGSMGPIIGPLMVRLGTTFEDIGAEADLSKAVHDANPNNPDNLKMLTDKVKSILATFGMGLDADGDRLGIVTYDGAVLRGDDISCIIAPVVIKEAIEKAKRAGIDDYKPMIVVNVLCSERLKRAIADAGGIAIECAVGFNKVKEAMITKLAEHYKAQYPGKNELKKGQTAEMGVEISSHIMFKENFNADDAFFAVIKLLSVLRSEAGKRGKDSPNNLIDVMLSELDAKLGIKDYHTGEWRTPMVSNQARIEVASRIKENYESLARERPDEYKIRNNLDGLKVDFLRNGESIGWLAVRPSGTSAEIVVAINSLVSEDVFNMIKNDFFAQMAQHKALIHMDKLEPEVYKEQARNYVVEGISLLVAPQTQATPGTNAITSQFKHSNTESYFAFDDIDNGNIKEAVRNFLTYNSEGQYLPAMEYVINNSIERYNRLSPDLRDKALLNLQKFFAGITARLPDIKNADTAKSLHVMITQANNINAWINAGVPLAANMRVTTNVARMVESPDKERGPSFLSAVIVGVDQAKAEGNRGIYWRGTEGVAKLGSNVSEAAVFDRTALDQARSILAMYIMVHGFVDVPQALREMTQQGLISTIHETVFAVNTLPGSIQLTSTGPGHFQGTSLDIKYVTEGRGIQYNKIYDANGKLVRVIAQELKPGTWVAAIPGAVDSVENLGGLRFNDFSVKVPQELLKGLNPWFDFDKMGEAEKNINEALKTVPYYAVSAKGEAVLVKNDVNAPEISWTVGIPSGEMGAASGLELYQNLNGAEDVARIVKTVTTSITLKGLLMAQSPIKTVPEIDASYMDIYKLASSTEAIIATPSSGAIVTKKYAWGGYGIGQLLGMGQGGRIEEPGERIAELWFNSTQADGLTTLQNNPKITLAEVIEANPRAMLGPGMTAKPIFTKILGRDETQPQMVHAGFNGNIKGNEKAFVGWVIQERSLVTELRNALAAMNMTEEQFNQYKQSYEAWVSAQVEARWTGTALPALPAFMAGFDTSIFNAIKENRAKIVSVMNEVRLEPGQVIISPVGYIHSIVGSHQTHPPSTHSEAKNEAWYIFSIGKDAAGKDRLLYFEPQQTSNTTYSPFDFPTPIVWTDGKVAMRKDLTKGLDALLKAGEKAPANEEEAIRLMADRALKFEPTKAEDFVVTSRTHDITSEFKNPVRAKAEALIEGTYPVWPSALFTLNRITLAGTGKTEAASITVEPVAGSYHELEVIKGEATITMKGKTTTLTPGSSVFVPASNQTSYELKAEGSAEILMLYPSNTQPKAEAVEDAAKRSRTKAAPADDKTAAKRTALKGRVTEKSGGETLSLDDVKALIEEEKKEAEVTLEASMRRADVDDGVVIIATDDNLYKGPANAAVTKWPATINKNAKPGTVVVVRGKGAELEANIKDAIERIGGEGKVRKIVTQLSADVDTITKEKIVNIIKDRSVILSIDLKGKSLDEHYLQVIRLFNLSFQIAYDFDADSISLTLSRIMGQSISIDEVMTMLAEKIIRILPRLEKIDTSTAAEAYKAVRQALVAL